MSPRPSQEEVFSSGEGDKWFLRNKQVLGSPESIKRDLPLQMIRQYELKPKRCLEIGCSNGWRLGEIQKQYGCGCVGVDPSSAAIADGATRYPGVTFHHGLASALPRDAGEQFDLVVVNFVLCWVSREELVKTIAEIDRCVADNGFLVVSDFSPDWPTRNDYHHLPEQGLFTWKTDYASIFEATALYARVAFMTFDHDKHEKTDASSQSRGFCCLMKKSLSKYYLRSGQPG